MLPFRNTTFAIALIAVGLLFNGSLSAQTAKKKVAQLGFEPLTFGDAAPEDDVDVEVAATLTAVDDKSADLRVTVTLPKGYYIYSMDKSFGAATQIQLTELGSLKESGDAWKADHEPKVVADDALGQTVEKFFSKVTWSKRVAGAVTADTRVVGKLNGQFCGSGEDGIPGECRPIRNREFTATAASTTTAPAASDASSIDSVPLDKNPVTVTPKIGFGKSAKTGLMEFEISLTPAKAAVGQEVTLSIKAKVKEPWHTFALDQDPEMAGQPTVIEVDSVTGLEAKGDDFRPSVEAEVKPIAEFIQRVHHGEVTWSKTYTLFGKEAALSGSVRFQMCSNGTCLPPTTAKFDLTLTAGEKPAPPVVKDDGAARGPVAEESNEGPAKDGFLAFVLTAIGAGFVALLTPCVFPMIPVTVAFFLKQEEKKAGSSLHLAIVYCLSIIGAFTILGLLVASIFGPTSLTTLANNRWLNLGFAALFTFFGVMLLGVIDIQLPSWLLTWTSKREATGGIIGVVFMALTFTLVSFTCTFAFVGSLLVLAARGNYLWPVVGMLGFSTAFASPFFLLALFPRMLKKLPRSGGWMNDVKVVIGIVELAAVVKFLSVADIGFSVGRIPVFLTYNIFMLVWIGLAATAGFYLLGILKQPRPKFSMIRYVSAFLFLALAGRLAAGLAGVKLPADPIWNLVAAFSPPDVEVRKTEELGYVIAHHKMDYALEFEKAVAAASRDQQPLFVDFTGVNCVNCRQMERTVMIEESVVAALQKLVRAQLYTDEVPGITDAEFRDKLKLMNQELQSSLVDDVTLPNYAVVSADGKTVLTVFKGLDQSGGTNFLEFLNSGLQRWESMKQQGVASADASNASGTMHTGSATSQN